MNGDNSLNMAISMIDSELFTAFMAEKDKFMVMYQYGVFALPFGKAVINFHEDHVQNIIIERSVYQYSKKPINI